MPNHEGLSPIGLAIERNSHRTVNLMLKELANSDSESISLLKDYFHRLIEFEFFDIYLANCFQQTAQMEEKNLFAGKSFNGNDRTFLAAHPTCFLDENFNDKFADAEEAPRPVDIKFLDFGWIIRSKSGLSFLKSLAYSERMEMFEIEAVKYLITYQWRILAPIIIKRLFMPFLLYFLILHAWIFIVRPARTKLNEDIASGKVNAEDSDAALIDIVVFLTWMAIVLGIIMQVYVEMKQIIFHKTSYFQDFWNLIDFFSILGVANCLFCSIFMPSWYEVSAVFMFLLLYTKFFYFLRIFESTASIVKSIIQIVVDCAQFLIVFIIGIHCFAFSFWVLNLAPNTNKDDSGQLV